MIRSALALGVMLLAGSVAIAAPKLTKAEQAAVNATPEEVAAKVAISNDPLDTVIKVSSEPFYVVRSGLLRMVNADKFVRAMIDKKTGETVFQVYIYTTYSGEWMFINRATIETPSGPEDANFVEIDRRVISCTGTFGCVHREDFAIDVPEKVLREVSRGAKGGTDDIWNMRLYAKTGQAETTGILKAEIAGLLIAVDREREKLKLATPK